MSVLIITGLLLRLVYWVNKLRLNASYAFCGQAGDDVMKQIEDEAMSNVKGLTSMDSNRDAMHEVIGHERDLILARCLPF